MSETLYKILGPDRMPCWGGSGQWHHCKWMPKVEVKPCTSGYHLCRIQDLPDWAKPGELWVAKGRGMKMEATEKVVFSEARLVKKVGDLSLSILVDWAEDCASRAVARVAKRDAEIRCAAWAARAAACAAAADADDAAAVWTADAALYADDAALYADDAALYADDAAAVWTADAARAAADAAAYAAAAWDNERKWQGERLLQLVSGGAGQ